MEIKQIKIMGKTLVLTMLPCISLLCSSCSESFSRITHQTNSKPIVKAVWIDSTCYKSSIRYFSGDMENVCVTSCSVDYSIKNGCRFFYVTSDDDTISFSVSDYYFGTNVDSVNIMIFGTSGKSSINVIPDCSWTMQGRMFTQGGRTMTEFCNISSTKPVHVAVFILVDWKKDNKKKTIYEYEKEVELMRLDSIIHTIP